MGVAPQMPSADEEVQTKGQRHLCKMLKPTVLALDLLQYQGPLATLVIEFHEYQYIAFIPRDMKTVGPHFLMFQSVSRISDKYTDEGWKPYSGILINVAPRACVKDGCHGRITSFTCGNASDTIVKTRKLRPREWKRFAQCIGHLSREMIQ
ncbi:hypothetical protein STEG23_020134, partial [Scotinomys teguina]